GTEDGTAPAKRLEALAATRVQNPEYPFIIKLYPGAGHRFDVAHPVDDPDSASAPRDYRAAAHTAALEAIDGFLTERAISSARRAPASPPPASVSAASCSGASRGASLAMSSSSCATLVALAIGAVTPGCAATQASAIWDSVAPVS